MHTTESQVLRPSGVDRRPEAPANSFYLAENVVFDTDLQAWVTGCGLEGLVPRVTNTYTINTFTTHRSIFEWTVGATSYLLCERQDPADAGKLSLFWLTRGEDRELVSGRTPTTTGNWYTPVGDWLLVLNGQDQPLKVGRNGRATPFGFQELPPAPQVYNTDTSRMVQQTSAANLTNQGLAVYPQYHLDTTAWGALDYLPSWGGSDVRYNGPKSTSYYGLGTTEANDVNTYGYKVAYVSDTGSLSGLSSAAYAKWQVNEKYDDNEDPSGNADNPNPYGVKYGVQLHSIPRGPSNTVARYIYRTKNLRDGILGAGEEYYLCAILEDNWTDSFVDFKPDNELVLRAPTTSEAYTVDLTHKTAAVWDGRLWLAGSASNPERVVYSEKGLPEQFSLTNLFDVSGREGGGITSLHAHQNMLVIIRENSTEAILKDGDFYTMTTLHAHVGTRSPHGAVKVPGGIMFVSEDGIWLVAGSTTGGGVPSIKRVSDPIQQWVDRINDKRLDLAQAAYSRKWKEVWFHVPVDESPVANLGLVYHFEPGGWSLRGSSEGDAVDNVPDSIFNFRSLTTDKFGEYLIGAETTLHKKGYLGQGIQVWSRRPTYIYYSKAEVTTDSVDASELGVANIYSTIMSQWTPTPTDKNQYMSIDFHLYEMGSTSFPVNYMTDRFYKWDQDMKDGDGGYPVIPLHPDDRGTNAATPMYGTSIQVTGRPLATYDESRLSDARSVTVRLDINPNIRDNVLWYTRTSEPVELTGWSWLFNPTRIKQRRS